MVIYILLVSIFSLVSFSPPPAFHPSPALWDSLNTRMVGGWRMGTPHALAQDLSRNLLFVGSGNGVWTIDVTDPLMPTSYPPQIQTYSTVVDLAYNSSAQKLVLATFWYGLEVWDVSNPFTPQLLGSWRDSSFRFHRLHLLNDTAVVVLQDSGVLILDLTDPTQISLLGHILPHQKIYGATREGNLLITAEDTLGARIFDISNPSAPVELSHILDTNRQVTDVSVLDSMLWVSVNEYNQNGMLHPPTIVLFDISNPNAPLHVGDIGDGNLFDTDLRVFFQDTSGAPSDTTAFVISQRSGRGWIYTFGSSPSPTLLDSLSLIHADDYLPGAHRVWLVSKNLYTYSLDRTIQTIFNYYDSTFPYAIYANDTLSIVGRGDAGFHIFSIQNPSSPVWLDSVHSSTRGYAYNISGSVLLEAGFYGLKTYDITDPANPVPLGSTLNNTLLTNMALQDTIVYTVSPGNGVGSLHIVSIANPAQPTLLRTLNIPMTTGSGIVSTPQRLFLSTDQGLQIYTLDTLSHPVLINTFLPSEIFGSLDIEGSLLFALWKRVNLSQYAVLILDISNPDQPVPLDTVSLTACCDLGGTSLDAQGPYVYVQAWWGRIQIIDVHNPSDAYVFRKIYPGGGSNSTAIHVQGNFLHTGHEHGYSILNIENPWAETLYNALRFPDYTAYLAGNNTWKVLGDAASFWILSPYTDSFATTNTRFPLFSTLNGLASKGRFLYAQVVFGGPPTWNSRLRVYDMTNPPSPVMQSEMALSQTSYEHGGQLRFLTDTLLASLLYPNLHLLSVSDTSQPVLLSTISGVGTHCVAYQENILYTCKTSTPDTLDIYDLTYPTVPQHLVSIPIQEGPIWDMAVQFFYAYLAQDHHGLGIYNIANTLNVYELGRWTGDGPVHRVAVSGRFAYILEAVDSAIEHFHILDISNPSAPADLGYYLIPDVCENLYLQGNHIYITTKSSGFYALEVLDLTPPPAPELLFPPADTFLSTPPDTFRWRRVVDFLSGIQQYEFQLSPDSLFSSYTSYLTQDTVLSMQGEMMENTYYWRVRAMDGSGLLGEWSSTYRFTLDFMPPGTPIPIIPTGGIAVGDTPVHFIWSHVTLAQKKPPIPELLEIPEPVAPHPRGNISPRTNMKKKFLPRKDPAPIRYILLIDTARAIVQPLWTDTLFDTTAAITGLPEGKLYWRVRAQDLAGNLGAYSPLDSFLLDLQPPAIESTTVWTDTSALGPFPIRTRVTDPLAGVDSVWLYYRTTTETLWVPLPMIPVDSGWYVDTIPPVTSQNDTIHYYIFARDLANPPHISTMPSTAPDSVFSFVAAQVGSQEAKEFPKKFRAKLLFPRVKTTGLIILLETPKTTTLDIHLYNALGRELYSRKDIPITPGRYTFPLRLPHSGIYFLHLRTGHRSWKFRFSFFR